MEQREIEVRVRGLTERLFDQYGPNGMPKDFHLHPAEWEELAALHGNAHNFPCFAVESDYGTLRFHSSHAQVRGTILAAKG